MPEQKRPTELDHSKTESKSEEPKSEPKSDPLVDLLSMVITRMSWNSEAEGKQAYDFLEELKRSE